MTGLAPARAGAESTQHVAAEVQLAVVAPADRGILTAQVSGQLLAGGSGRAKAGLQRRVGGGGGSCRTQPLGDQLKAAKLRFLSEPGSRAG